MLNFFEIFDKEKLDTKYTLEKTIINSINFENIPNLLIYGTEKAAKEYMLNLIITTKKKKTVNSYIILSKEVFFTTYETNNIIEINLSEIKMYKNIFLKKFIKNISQTYSVFNNKNKIIIIHGLELLNKNDQFILRKIMEDNIKSCRFILFSNSIDNLLIPIISRCLTIRLGGFNNYEISKHTSNKKHISDNNLYKSVLNSEIDADITKYKIKNHKNYKNYQDDNIKKVNKFITSTRKINKKDIKNMEVIINNLNINFELSYTEILKLIMNIFLKNKKTHSIRSEIYMKTLEYENRIKIGSKGIIHLQSYIFYLKKYNAKLN